MKNNIKNKNINIRVSSSDLTLIKKIKNKYNIENNSKVIINALQIYWLIGSQPDFKMLRSFINENDKYFRNDYFKRITSED